MSLQFRLQINATQVAGTSGTAGDMKWWSITGAIKRLSGAGTTAIVGTPVVVNDHDAAAATWYCQVSADTVSGALEIEFTGEANKDIQVVCVAEFSMTRWT